jgi:hypothetical protein
MLDLETLGNGNNKVICQIGACEFDLETGEIGKTFKVNVDAETHVREGGNLDAKTVYWWLSQDKEAINSIIADPKLPIREAFNQLNDFLKDAKQIWSHSTFDFVTIQDTYNLLGIKTLFRYNSARDIRTLVSLANISIDKTPREGVHHDALHDCLHQVKYCVQAYRKLRGLK